MSWRTVVITSNAKLDYQLGCLVVRKDKVTKIHLSEVSVLLIESTAVSMTAVLLNALIEKKIKVIFCDEKRNPSAELVPYYGCHDSSQKMRSQIRWSEGMKEAVWTEIVTEKIRQQAELLENIGRQESNLLEEYIEELEPGDATNREGHAAKVYFNALFGMDFSRSSMNSINAALNYGYGILLSAFNREIAANGYLTQLGLFHDNMFNHFNLGSDLMEPFRPLIDRIVYGMMPDKFEKEEKLRVLSVLNEEVWIGNKREYVNNAIRTYCKSVFDAIEEQDVSMIRFYRNEL